ncbi:MAG: flagellar basal-body rod protein FlgG [Peptococcaceae bacterium]|nr:flagellar basal-body rod protein FlgG [Peptococcaceae bacterium]
MIRSLKNSAAGINVQQARIDITANNIAGVNTDGFKSARPSFADLVYSKMSGSGRPVKANGANPLHGAGSRPVGSFRNFDQGVLRETGRETDLAIEGAGFFKVLLPDGSAAYTRNGNFRLNADRELVTDDGYKFYPEITVPEECQELTVDVNGKVRAKDAEGQFTDLADIAIYSFVNPEGLQPLGGNLYAATEAAGPEEEGIPGRDGYGKIIQRSLESSNVDIAVEMTELLESQRAYQINARALRLSDEMWGLANNLRK